MAKRVVCYKREEANSFWWNGVRVTFQPAWVKTAIGPVPVRAPGPIGRQKEFDNESSRQT